MPLRPPAALPPLLPPARAPRAADGERRGASPGPAAPTAVRPRAADADTARRLVAAVGTRARFDPERAGGAAALPARVSDAPATPGRIAADAPAPEARRAYGAALYLAAGALRPRSRGEAVEVWVRRTPDGGRVTVARRTAGAHTVAIEAQIA